MIEAKIEKVLEKTITHLLNNCYFKLGTIVFGYVNAMHNGFRSYTLLFANLFLYSHESRWIQKA